MRFLFSHNAILMVIKTSLFYFMQNKMDFDFGLTCSRQVFWHSLQEPYNERPLGGRVNLAVFSELKDPGVNRKHIFLLFLSG